jgi:glutaminase
MHGFKISHVSMGGFSGISSLSKALSCFGIATSAEQHGSLDLDVLKLMQGGEDSAAIHISTLSLERALYFLAKKGMAPLGPVEGKQCMLDIDVQGLSVCLSEI